MIKSNKGALLAAVLLASGALGGLTACSSGAKTSTTNAANTAAVNKTAGGDISKPDAVPPRASTGDSIGVPECDEYIAKYEACITKKVPEAQRALFQTSFESARKNWKDAAANPQGKAALATGCKQALDTAKQTMTAFSCDW